MKKILFIGSNNKNSLEYFYMSAIKKRGVAVDILPLRDWWRQKRRRSLLSRIVSRLFPGLFCRSLNERLLSQMADEYYDAILVFKGMELLPRTVRALKRFASLLAIFNPDHPFIYSMRGSGNSLMRRSMRHYDLYITYARDIYDQLEYNGIKAGRVPFGYYIEEEWYQQAASQNEILKICFLGNGDKMRADFLNNLADAGLPVVVYGTDWNGLLNKKIERHDGVYGLEFWKVLRRYRVQLNMMRTHNLRSHNMRTFDIPAIGGIQVAPRTPEHEEFFDDGEEIFLYESPEDCARICTDILNLSFKEAEKIRVCAQERSFNSKYSYEDRADDILNLLIGQDLPQKIYNV
ncbi:MAG: glycosyltransferase [Saprospiraceae bacterium]|nr:glycosyltransferase [Saprospiraceae bacterium]